MKLFSTELLKTVSIITVIWMGLGACVGCQRRAYTDLYVENMAGEIRELENRIYEYDSAYQQAEDELDIIRSENDSLRNELSQRANTQAAMIPELKHRLESARMERVERIESTPNIQLVPKAESKPKAGSSLILPPQSKSVPEPIADPIADQPRPSSSPNIKYPDTKTPTPKTPAPKPILPGNKKSSDFNSSDLEPPEIDLGVPASSNLQPFKAPSGTSPTRHEEVLPLLPPPLSSSIESNRIDVPGMTSNPSFVSQATSTQGTNSLASQDENVQIASFTSPSSPRNPVMGQPQFVPAPTDTHVIEIAFHPTLCRGSNRDRDPKEDGLHLVLQPRNEKGEFIAEAANMTIVVVDPQRPSNESKIGRWTWTADQMQEALQPIGVSQGFHVAVAWQSKRPLAKQVQVHVRYEMVDGRKLVNQREIALYVPSLGSDAWTPRVVK